MHRPCLEEDFDDLTMDACLIAAGQRAEHYEIGAYGTVVAWAEAMGHNDAVALLRKNLEEEKAADKKLSALAEGGINQQAAKAAHPGGTRGGHGQRLNQEAEGDAMTTTKQRSAARRNIKKAARTAKRKRTVAHLPKRTKTALGREGAKAAKRA